MNLAGLSKISNKLPLAKAETIIESAAVNAFNKAGNRVASKQTATAKKVLKLLNAPYGAKNAEVLKVEKQFGKKYSEIISFKDEENKLIERFRAEYENGVELWHSNTKYTKLKSNPTNTEYKAAVIDKQKTKYNPQGTITEVDRHACDYYDYTDGVSALSQLKYKGAPNVDGSLNETFSISEKLNDGTEKLIKGSAIRNANGNAEKIKINTSGNIPEEILQDPYLIMRTMPAEHSIKYLLQRFGQKMKINTDEINLVFIKGADKEFVPGLAQYDQKKLYVAAFNNLGENINTVSHELRHWKQNENASSFFSLLKQRIKDKSSVNDREFSLAKLFFFKTNFSNPLINRTSYIEKDAWKIGERYQNEYIDKTEKFKETFKYFSKQTLGINNFFK